jgi:mRNA interferase RelE/StbE
LKIIEEIESANSLLDINNIKKLSGDKISYRIRLGDYRLGIFYENNTVELVRFVHRKDIYKVFP